MTQPPLIWPLIAAASLDPDMRAVATRQMRTMQELLCDNHERQPGRVRISDAGRCSREVWADINGLLSLPQDGLTQISRFDIGTIYGAWLAALLYAALQRANPDWNVVFEHVIHDAEDGHIDVYVEEVALGGLTMPLWVVEFKTTYWSKALEAPEDAHPYHVYQAVQYARRKAALWASVFTMAPAGWPDRYRQDNYRVEEWDAACEQEFHRLHLAAQSKSMPPADVSEREKWRCKSCRFAGCERNVHPLNKVSMAS